MSLSTRKRYVVHSGSKGPNSLTKGPLAIGKTSEQARFKLRAWQPAEANLHRFKKWIERLGRHPETRRLLRKMNLRNTRRRRELCNAQPSEFLTIQPLSVAELP